MTTFFSNYGHLIVFLHVLSAIIWVGGMIAIRIAAHPVVSRGEGSLMHRCFSLK